MKYISKGRQLLLTLAGRKSVVLRMRAGLIASPTKSVHLMVVVVILPQRLMYAARKKVSFSCVLLRLVKVVDTTSR